MENLQMNERMALEHLSKIREDYTRDGRVLEALGGAMWVIEKTFPRTGHFLLEFFQNAEDAKATEIEAVLEGNFLKVYNNGASFSPEDVETICSIGRSRKDPKEYLGYLGVGFKSIFLISSSPHIYSIPYRFKFDRNAWPDAKKVPWRITPIWIDEIPVEILEKIKRGGVIFYVPIKFEGVQKLQMEFEDLRPRTILFLRHLNRIRLLWNGKAKVIEKSLLEKKDDYEIYQIKFQPAEKTEVTKWVVFRFELQVPENIRMDSFTKEWNRETVEKREIAIAFRLTDQLDLTREPSGTVAFGIFSHIPTREVEYGIPFMLHADFLTAPGREEINYEASWNRWLLEEAVKFITQKIIKIFQSHEKWRFSYTTVLLTSTKPYIVSEYLLNPIEKEIREGAHLITHDGYLVRPDEAISVSESVKELLGVELIEKLSRKKMLHNNCQPSPLLNVQSFYSVRDFFTTYPLSDINHFQVIFGNQWRVCYKRCLLALATEFCNYSETYQRQIRYSYLNVTQVLDQQDQIHGVLDLRIPENAEIETIAEAHFAGKFRFLHSDLRDELILKYLKTLGMRKLTEDELEILTRKERVPQLLEKLKDPLLPDEEKVSYIRLIKEWWEKGIVSPGDIQGKILVKTKTGRWLDPREVWFSSEYEPEKNLELLLKKRILDGDYEYLDPVFIREESHERTMGWRKFFEELQLGKNIDENKIAWRVGILAAIRYEEEKCGVKGAHELPESEARGRGFDILSKMPDGRPKFIEAKGRSGEYPITLTKAETKMALEEGEHTFIYITSDALSKPTLFVLRGKTLAGLAPLVTITPADWKRLKEDLWTP
jgi:hypothetical protein